MTKLAVISPMVLTVHPAPTCSHARLTVQFDCGREATVRMTVLDLVGQRTCFPRRDNSLLRST